MVRRWIPLVVATVLWSASGCGVFLGDMGAAEKAARDAAPPDQINALSREGASRQAPGRSEQSATGSPTEVTLPVAEVVTTTSTTTTVPFDPTVAFFCLGAARFFVLDTPKLMLLADPGATPDEIQRNTAAFDARWQALVDAAPAPVDSRFDAADALVKGTTAATRRSGKSLAESQATIAAIDAMRVNLLADVEPWVAEWCGNMYPSVGSRAVG